MRETAKVIKPHNMVGVRMGEDHGVDMANIFAQRLGPEIGAGIHDPGRFRCLDVDRRAQAFIARIGRLADGAVAADHRHALRSARAQKGERELRVERCDWSWQALKVGTLTCPLPTLNLSCPPFSACCESETSPSSKSWNGRWRPASLP